MALTCGITLSSYAVVAGQSPGCVATLTVSNPSASAVVVTGAQLTFKVAGASQPSGSLPLNPPLVPLGLSPVVSAGGSLSFGPMPLQFSMPSNANAYLSLGPSNSTLTGNSALALPPQMQVVVGAIVQASDGSVNLAAASGVTVSFNSLPPLGTQGGFFQFSAPTNFITGLCFGVL